MVLQSFSLPVHAMQCVPVDGDMILTTGCDSQMCVIELLRAIIRQELCLHTQIGVGS